MGPGCCALYLESRLSDGNGNLILVKYYSLKTVPDHYLLDPISASMHAIDCVKRVLLIIVSVSVHQRPHLASGISLYVSDDPQGSNVCNTMVRRVP